MSIINDIYIAAKSNNRNNSYIEFNAGESGLLPICLINPFTTRYITYLQNYQGITDTADILEALEDKEKVSDFIRRQKLSIYNIFNIEVPSSVQESRASCTKNYFLDTFNSSNLKKITFTKKAETYIIGQNMIFNRELEPIIIMSIPVCKIGKVLANVNFNASLIFAHNSVFDSTKILVNKRLLDKSNPYSCIMSLYKSIFYPLSLNTKTEIVLTDIEDYISKPILNIKGDLLSEVSELIKQDSFTDKIDEFLNNTGT